MADEVATLADEIRSAISDSGITHYAIATGCGIHPSQVARFMSGQSLNLDTASRIFLFLRLAVMRPDPFPPASFAQLPPVQYDEDDVAAKIAALKERAKVAREKRAVAEAEQEALAAERELEQIESVNEKMKSGLNFEEATRSFDPDDPLL